jgi:hypothetical protein
MTGKIVWILGAGFSQSLGAPLLRELFSQAQLDRVLGRYGNVFNSVVDLESLRSITRLYSAGAYEIGHAGAVQTQWRHAEQFLERLDIAADNGIERQRLALFCDAINQHEHETNRYGKDLFGDMLGLYDSDCFRTVHLLALKLLAAECCAFLEDANPDYEIWSPYRRWAELLTPQDTVLTFNYDRVPDILSAFGKIHIPVPSELLAPQVGQRTTHHAASNATVLKLHGCVTWIDEGAEQGPPKIVRAATLDQFRGGGVANVAALHCERKAQLAIATPGPTKQRRVDRIESTTPLTGDAEAGLNWLWQSAQAAIERADAIVVLGYSLPPTDAYTRAWLLRHIKTGVSNIKNGFDGAHRSLPIHIVLGPDIDSPPIFRLASLFENIRGTQVRRARLWVEDFLSAFDRDELAARA